MCKEVRVLIPFKTIPYDIVKSSMTLFINELVYKSLREEEANPELFSFLYTSVEVLDMHDHTPVDFHLWFAVRFSRFLGFYPMDNYSSAARVFDLKEGIFRTGFPDHFHYLEFPLSRYMHELAFRTQEEIPDAAITNTLRRLMIRKVVEYYRLHLPGFPELKSPDVLEKILE